MYIVTTNTTKRMNIEGSLNDAICEAAKLLGNVFITNVDVIDGETGEVMWQCERRVTYDARKR